MNCDCGPDSSVQVQLGPRSYEIAITTHRLNQFATLLTGWLARRQQGRPTRQCLIVTDEHIAQTHAAIVSHSLNQAGWRPRTIVMPAGETTKSLAAASQVYDALVEMKADRQTVIVAVGGGVIGDLAGFVASTYNRGLLFVQVPTTLLAQVDSSVGGKVGINHPRGKNLIGAFHQPLGVLLDTSVLTTLPDREYRAGLAEVVKYGVILDADFFDFLVQNVERLNQREPAVLQQIIARSCRLKAQVVEQDEHELSGIRACLNYGHTFAHAFEALAGYGELLHGEAVGIGMICASRLSERLGRIPAEMTEQQIALLQALHIPTQLPDSVQLAPEAVVEAMRLDKKAVSGELRFVLPTRMGHVETVSGVPESLVLEVLQQRG